MCLLPVGIYAARYKLGLGEEGGDLYQQLIMYNYWSFYVHYINIFTFWFWIYIYGV